jgi:hypothetical protein
LRLPIGSVKDGVTQMRIALVFTIALLAGCSSHFSVGELAGKYVLSLDGGTDTIELSANGTYSHTYTAKSGNVGHQEDTWTLEELQAGPTVVLNNFHLLYKEDVGGRGAYYHLLVNRSFGNLYLITNIDLNEGYKKQQ